LMDKLFVYGTLKRGFPLHRWMSRSEYIGKAETTQLMAMYSGGIPFVTDREQVSRIHGELFSVDADTLRGTDRVEGHPVHYTRRLTKVRTHDGEEHEAWLYFYDHELVYPHLVPTGSYIY